MLDVSLYIASFIDAFGPEVLQEVWRFKPHQAPVEYIITPATRKTMQNPHPCQLQAQAPIFDDLGVETSLPWYIKEHTPTVPKLHGVFFSIRSASGPAASLALLDTSAN